MRCLPYSALALLVLSSATHADRVHLVDGAVLEGRASQQGDKVVIELAEGTMALDADSVERNEQAESPVERVELRRAQLGSKDIAGRIALADYCRDNAMRGREIELLREVIALAPDHAEARERLGFVRQGSHWITRDEQRVAEGLVLHEGRWITREQLLQLERLRAEAEQAELARDKAKVELQTRQAELDAARQAPAATAPEPETATTVIQTGSYPYFLPPAVAPAPPRVNTRSPRCGAPPCPDQRPRRPRMNPHVRDPYEYL